jgi:GTP-binding protein
MEERGTEAHAISAVSQEGVQALMQRTFALLRSLPPPEPVREEIRVFRPVEQDDAFTVERDGDGWRVHGAHVERVAAMTPFGLPEAVARFQRQLRAMGVVEALEEAGVLPGDTVHIGDRELEWQP